MNITLILKTEPMISFGYGRERYADNKTEIEIETNAHGIRSMSVCSICGHSVLHIAHIGWLDIFTYAKQRRKY